MRTTQSSLPTKKNAMEGTFCLGAVAQNSPGMLVEKFLEDEELARIAPSCHLSMNLFCQEMHAFQWCRVCVFGVVRRWPYKSSDRVVGCQSWETCLAPATLGGVCLPDTWAARFAPSLDSLALVAW